MGAIPAVGGAMELALGARNVYVMTDLLTTKGDPKLVSECTYPLTGAGCVDRCTQDAIFDVIPEGYAVIELFGRVTIAQIEDLTGLTLIDVTDQPATAKVTVA